MFSKKQVQLEKIALKKHRAINAVITEQALLITQHENERLQFTENYSHVDLVKQIQMFATFAYDYHKQNFSNDGNNITTLLTNEFQFYPSCEAISLPDFLRLCSELESIGKQYTQNLFLILSSFPIIVQTPSDQNEKAGIVNCVIHLQCGEQPIIHLVNKSITGYSDVHVITHDVHAYQLGAASLPKQTSFFLAPDKDTNDTLLNFKNCIECETLTGAKFFRVIDICLEMYYGKGKRDYEIAVKTAQQETLTPLPQQISQVFTSNTAEIVEKGLLIPKDKVIHADPCHALKDNANTQKIYSSPLGLDLLITYCDPQTLSLARGEIGKIIKLHNANVTNQWQAVYQEMALEKFYCKLQNCLNDRANPRLQHLHKYIQVMMSSYQDIHSPLDLLIKLKEIVLLEYYAIRKSEGGSQGYLFGKGCPQGDKLETFIQAYIWVDVPHVIRDVKSLPPSIDSSGNISHHTNPTLAKQSHQ